MYYLDRITDEIEFCPQTKLLLIFLAYIILLFILLT